MNLFVGKTNSPHPDPLRRRGRKTAQKSPKSRSPSIKRGLGGVLHFY